MLVALFCFAWRIGVNCTASGEKDIPIVAIVRILLRPGLLENADEDDAAATFGAALHYAGSVCFVANMILYLQSQSPFAAVLLKEFVHILGHKTVQYIWLSIVFHLFHIAF